MEVTSYDTFGGAVAINDANILIGASGDDTQGDNVGQAHLFDSMSGTLLQTFDDPTPTRIDSFGDAVAMDGTKVLISATGDDTHGTNVGQAYLFDAATGTLLQTFDDPTPTAFDFFGGAVAMDDAKVLIGAGGDDTKGTNAGQAHLFDAATGTLLHTFDDPTPTAFDFFGGAVAMDDAKVLIGASGDDTKGNGVGQAHLFDSMSGTLLQTFDDPTPTGSDSFGLSVALDGTNVLIGARFDDSQGNAVGQAHLFDAVTGTLLQTFDDPTPTTSDTFGYSVALDGTNVLIGARFDDSQGTNVGQAHLFDAVTGTLLQTFDDPTPTPGVPQRGAGDFFGSAAALDRTNVVIGAPRDDTQGVAVGQAHLFNATTGKLLQSFDDPTVVFTPVPIPATLFLLGAGLCSLGAIATARHVARARSATR